MLSQSALLLLLTILGAVSSIPFCVDFFAQCNIRVRFYIFVWQWVPTSCVAGIIFFPLCVLDTLVKTRWTQWCAFISRFSILLHLSMFKPVTFKQCHTITFGHRISVCIWDWLRTQYITKTGLENPASASRVLELQACIHLTRNKKHFNTIQSLRIPGWLSLQVGMPSGPNSILFATKPVRKGKVLKSLGPFPPSVTLTVYKEVSLQPQRWVTSTNFPMWIWK